MRRGWLTGYHRRARRNLPSMPSGVGRATGALAGDSARGGRSRAEHAILEQLAKRKAEKE